MPPSSDDTPNTAPDRPDGDASPEQAAPDAAPPAEASADPEADTPEVDTPSAEADDDASDAAPPPDTDAPTDAPTEPADSSDDPTPDPHWADKGVAAWEPPTALALGLIALLGAVILPLAQARIGLWEPWETSWAEIARTMRSSGDWFTPTLGGQPAPRPLLTVWAIALGQALGGGAEWVMRWPMALSITAGASALFLWLKEAFSARRGLIAALAAVACPQVALSAMTLAGNGVALGVSMATLALFGLLVTRAPEHRGVGLKVGFGLMVGLNVLSWGLWGAYMVALVVVGLGIAQITQRAGSSDDDTPSPKRAALLIGAAVATLAALLGWGWWQEWNAKAAHLLMASLPLVPIVAGGLYAARSRALRSVANLSGALALATTAIAAIIVGSAWSGVENTASLTRGFVGLHVLLENHLHNARALPDHVSFDFWIRQIGFAAFPWTVLAPFGMAYLIRRDDATTLPDAPPTDTAADDSGRIVVLWFIVSCLVAGVVGTVHEHYLFPGVSAIGCAVGLMLTDHIFWDRLRTRPVVMRTIGLAAIFGALFLCKDFERYPRELIGPLLTDGTVELPKDFAFGRSLKVVRAALAASLALFTFGALSVALRLFKRVRGTTTADLLGRATQDLRAAHAPILDMLPEPVPAAPEPSDAPETPAPPAQLSLAERHEDAWHASPESVVDLSARLTPGPLGAVIRWAEVPGRFAWVFTAICVVVVVLMSFVWVPRLSDHLSIRGLLDNHAQLTQDAPAPLRAYNMGKPNTSYYLADVEPITQKEIKDQFDQDGRFFIVFPREQLSRLNHELRRGIKDATKRPILHVLDDRSSRYLLASNVLRDGEQERSPVAHALVEGRPKPRYPFVVKDAKGTRQYIQFDKRIQFLGYDLYSEDEVDRWGNPTPEAIKRRDAEKAEGKLPSFATGETMVIRYYFKVLKRMTSNYQMFLHMDYPGTRINGDHYPIGGDFPTNHWLPGDYVVNAQRLNVERGSSSGTYSLNMGFFVGSRRMKVTPKSGHDGQNRVSMGKVDVTSF